MRSAFSAVLLVVLVFACPRAATAGPIFDFSSLSAGGNITALGTFAVLPGGIIGGAFHFDNGIWNASTLIGRNEPDDTGLGVCSEGAANCGVGGHGSGETNELSQLLFNEVILLIRPADMNWSALWLSSLDAGGHEGAGERGTLFWTNGAGTTLSGPFNFLFPHFGDTTVSGQMLLPGDFDPEAMFLFFLPGGSVGQSNDYLVWGADLQPPNIVPEPGTLTALLLGTGLCALARRRSKRA